MHACVGPGMKMNLKAVCSRSTDGDPALPSLPCSLRTKKDATTCYIQCGRDKRIRFWGCSFEEFYALLDIHTTSLV